MKRLASVKVRGQRRAAIVDDRRVFVTPSGSLDELIRRGEDVSADQAIEYELRDVNFDAPLRPPVLLCCGQNYAGHLAEQARTARAYPEFFVKAGMTIAAPDEPLVYASHTQKLDYETELGIVIGRDAYDVALEDALDYVLGYVVVNDLSARDRQIKPDGRSSTGAGKNFDGATRLSSWIVPAAEIPDPQVLSLTTWVNGERRQSDTTANMIFTCAEIVSAFSRALTIPAGVIVATGTPGGTGLGCDVELRGTGVTPDGCVPARYLEPGDVVVSEIENVGTLTFETVGSRSTQVEATLARPPAR